MTRRAITGARLIDGTGAEPRSETTVIWDENRIDWVGPDADADLSGVDPIDAGGDTVLPGLIDCHVHLCLDATIDGVDRVAGEPVALVAIRAGVNAGRHLAAGVTSVRDMGSASAVAVQAAAAQRAGLIAGSRVVAAGRGITPTGGHGWTVGSVADGPDAVRRAVRAEIAGGAAVIKLFVTGGVLGSGAHGMRAMMTVDEVAAAVVEAHQRGRKVAAHVHGAEGIDVVLEAGVDTIEHGTGLTEDQAGTMAERGVAMVPTLAAADGLLGAVEHVPPDVLSRIRAVAEVIMDSVRNAIDRGVRVLPGTDAGTPFNPPGRLVVELSQLADLGLGAAGAIHAATGLAADTLGLEGIGTVEAGNMADLISVEGDPFSDLRVLADPRLVVQDGIVRA